MTMSDYSEYDQFLKDAEKDTRLGKQTFVITEKLVDAWGDGSPRYKFRGVLATASNAKTDMTLSPPPPLEVAQAAEPGRKRGIALAIQNLKALAAYGKNLDTLSEGDELSVETRKDEKGYVRVSRILNPGESMGTSAKTDRIAGPGF
jgi:hypothetical protein